MKDLKTELPHSGDEITPTPFRAKTEEFGDLIAPDPRLVRVTATDAHERLAYVREFPSVITTVSVAMVASNMLGIALGSLAVGLVRDFGGVPISTTYAFSSAYTVVLLAMAYHLARTRIRGAWQGRAGDRHGRDHSVPGVEGRPAHIDCLLSPFGRSYFP